MFEALNVGGPLQARFITFHEAMRAALADAVRRGVADGSVRADIDPEREGTLLVSALRGIAYQWLLDPEHFDPEPAYTHLIETTRDRLRPSR